MNLKQVEVVTDVDKLKVDLQYVLNKYETIKQWAYIIHDKDDTRPHYHIYLNFGKCSCDTKVIADWFKLEENFVNKVKGRKADMLLYLTHGNDSQKHKHQYDKSEVVSNFDFETEIENNKIIGDFKNYSYSQQLQYINTLPVSEKSKVYLQLKRLWELECQCLAMETTREIEVVFITGKPETGKTLYAKKMLEKLGYDYAISSANNDPFQDYLGQRAIILDDLRDTAFDLSDILKLLDNNTSSSVKSRFNNKIFNGKMIIITSSVPIRYWYSYYKINSHDSLVQLYRRISCYVELTEKNIIVYDGLESNGMGKGLGTVFKNTIKQENFKISKTDFNSLFSEISEKIPEQLIELTEKELENLPF